MNQKEVLDHLEAALGRHHADAVPEVRQLFLVGFLSSLGALPCDVLTYDKATDAFLTATRLTSLDWLDVLACWVASKSGSFADEAYLAYLERNVKDYAAVRAPHPAPAPKAASAPVAQGPQPAHAPPAVGPAAPEKPPAPPEPPTPLRLLVTVIGSEWTRALAYLEQKRPSPDQGLGFPLMRWEVPHPELGDRRVDVVVTNAQGGPSLVGYLWEGNRIIDSTKPQYSLTEALEFVKGPRRVVVSLEPRPEGADQGGQA